MGCDIHMHIEVKVESKWEHYAAPWVRRSYSLFEKLAGVRGEIENAIVAPKGLPYDMSIITRKAFEKWEEDAHSESWLSLEEICKLEEWLDDKNKNDVEYRWKIYDLERDVLNTFCEGYSFAGILRYPEEKPEWIEDVRFVFWFDN